MRRRKSVVVELTALLDVIFIMLFMVMNRSQNEAAEAQEEAAASVAQVQAEAQADIEAYKIENEQYKALLEESETQRESIAAAQNRIESYEEFAEMAEIVTVYVFDSGYKRSVKVETEQQKESIDFDWENMDYAREKLAEVLDSLAENAECPVFMVFSYNGDMIYRRDYNMVTEVMTEVQEGYDRVYIKFNDTSE